LIDDRLIIASNGYPSWNLGSCSVTCHLTQVNVLFLNP